MKQGSTPEFERFDKTVRALLAVPHSELKKKLDAEKRAKKRKKNDQKQEQEK